MTPCDTRNNLDLIQHGAPTRRIQRGLLLDQLVIICDKGLQKSCCLAANSRNEAGRFQVCRGDRPRDMPLETLLAEGTAA